MRELIARLVDWFRRDRLDRELAEELHLHRQLLERDAGGLAEDAHFVASRRLGNVTRVREAARQRWSIPSLDHWQLALAGVACGLIVALSLSRWIQPLLFQQSATDARVYFGVATLMIIVALSAGAFPAFRAARADPNTALRAE